MLAAKALHEKKQDRLDKEYEVHSKAEGSFTTNDLKAKLERLKAEVNFLQQLRRLHTTEVDSVVVRLVEEGTSVELCVEVHLEQV